MLRPGASGTAATDGVEGELEPTLLVATTVKEYLSALVRPVTVIGLVDPLTLCPPRTGLVASVAVTV